MLADFELLDLELTVELYKQKRIIERRRLSGLLAECEEEWFMGSNVVERLKTKAMQARGVVPRIVAKVEANLDKVIAAEPDLEKQNEAAFAPHFEAIAETETTLAGVGDALNIMSNGGPPLSDSAHVAPALHPVSTDPVTPSPLSAGAPSQTPQAQ